MFKNHPLEPIVCEQQLTQLRAAQVRRVISIEKSNLHVQPHPLGYLESPAVLSDPSSPVHLSISNIPASGPTSMLILVSRLTLAAALAKHSKIRVPMKSFNLLKRARGHRATVLQVQHTPPEPAAHHSFPLLCWAPTCPCGFPRTWYSLFLFDITPHRGCCPLLFGFKWLGSNAERRK